MPTTDEAIQAINRTYRDFKRYTGDGLPGEPLSADLPIGDPQSGPHNPKKAEIRAAHTVALVAAAQSVADATDQADRAQEEADRAYAASTVATGAMSAVVLAENTFATKATAEAFSPVAAPAYIRTAGHGTAGDGGGTIYSKLPDGVSRPGDLAITLDDGETVARYVPDTVDVHVEAYGAYGDNSTDCTDALVAALTNLQRFPKLNIDTIGGEEITMYRSGRVNFGPGVFRVEAGALEFASNMGVEFSGAGSRGMTNAMRARTTLLITGTGEFGIRAYRGGARNLGFRTIDVCYESSSFTGDLVDVMDAPGFYARDCFFGTFGIIGGSNPDGHAIRHQSARSLIRQTYDEGVLLDHCVLDGAEVGFWMDDTRVELDNNGFGGWGTKIRDTVFFDFTENHILQTNSGTRVRSGVTLDNVNVNPINVSPTRAIDLDITRGFSMQGCSLVSSVAAAPSEEWMRLKSVVGTVTGNRFGELANGVTIEGTSAVVVEGNVFETYDLNHAVRLRGGSNRVSHNRFDAATNAILVQPDGSFPNHLEGSGNMFRDTVTTSVYVPTDSAVITGSYVYEPALDLSQSKHENNAAGFQIGALTLAPAA